MTHWSKRVRQRRSDPPLPPNAGPGCVGQPRNLRSEPIYGMLALKSIGIARTGRTPVTDPNDISSLPQADQDAIGATLISLLTGFRERNAEKLVGIYTADADWVNAFGSVKKGGDEIVEYLRGLFSDDNFNAGTVKAPPETSMKVLTPEVVLVSAHLQVEGQKLVGGGEIEVRDNHSLRVLHRQADGSWLIASEMYNDANREQTYESHP